MKNDRFEYQGDGTTFVGALVYEEGGAAKKPGILVIHEAWGLDEHARTKAEAIAKLGYVALAVDMFGDGKEASDTQDGFAKITALSNDPAKLRARARAALDALAAAPNVDASKLASIGYCFGGTTSLELARSGAPLKAVVSFHGNLQTQHPAEAGKVHAKVLAATGGADPFIPFAQLEAFSKEMEAAAVDYQLVMYGGAKHSFTNSTAADRGIDARAYSKSADERSWAAMSALFVEAFR